MARSFIILKTFVTIVTWRGKNFFESFGTNDRLYQDRGTSMIITRVIFAARKPTALRLRVSRALGMAARPSEAGRRRNEPESRGRTEGQRHGRRSATVRAAAGAARSRVPGSGSACLLLRTASLETGDPGHPAVLRSGVVAEQESLRLARLSGGLSLLGQR